ncbi:MAG: replication-relaxation family protein [Rhodomicrobiaceae bacterium]
MSEDAIKSRLHSYRPRRVRSDNPPPFQLTRRDIKMIHLVAKYRFLNSDQIRKLVKGSHKNITNRLKTLFEYGYLDRPDCQFETYRLGGGTSPLVYALTDKGAHLLANECEYRELTRHGWSAKNKSAGRPFLKHTLAIADFVTSLQLAISNRDDVQLIDSEALENAFPMNTQELSKPYRLNISVIHQGTRSDIGLEPDYAFALYLPQMQKRAHFLVEIDRGTMPVLRRDLKQSSVLRKLLAYQSMWKMKRHTVHFGWQNFRVLFVTTNTERVENMIEATNSNSQTEGSPLFLFADKPELNENNLLLDKWNNLNGIRQSLLPKS